MNGINPPWTAAIAPHDRNQGLHMADNRIQHIELKRLKLDPENPILPISVQRDQSSMLDYIAESTAIEDLMGAISENDFFPGEPVVAIPDGNDFIVVEGNRRLTAVLLLHNPERCSSPSARMREISANARYKPDKLPVVKCDARTEVLPYLGFRHITGIKEWEPLAKARYMKQLFDLVPRNMAPAQRYKEVARSIGSRSDHIKRNLDALAVYGVIEAQDFFNIEELDEESIKFAVLSTALANDRIGNFVGIVEKDGDDDFIPLHPIVNPQVLKRHEIRELTEWLYKRDEKGRTRVGESRKLRELAAIVDAPRALAAFREGATLQYAYQLTSDIAKDFLELLYQAEGSLTEAAGMVATMDYDEQSIRVSKRILETIRLIGKTLNEKRKPDEDDF
jgi:hypothetical protein